MDDWTSESDHSSSETNDSIEEDLSVISNDEDFKAKLQECLDDVQQDGTFFSFQTYDQYVNPGLQVKELGTIGLPLSERDAQAIACICKQSPFGKGDKTLIDQRVRKTWELDTTEFSLRNPAWVAYLDHLRGIAVENLGVQVSCIAQPYKLLLYEEGAFFKAHRDTEKVPGMFGTMVICLPSEHTGGDVLLDHNKGQHTIASATSSAFDLSAFAWYSDVQHEIQPVTSGFRLVLTYNLVQDLMLPKQSARALDASDAKLANLLCRWKEDFGQYTHFIYPLEHQYTDVSLSLQNLKGHDAAKGRYLEKLCQANGFYWFLSEMTKTTREEMYDDDDGNESIDLGTSVIPSGLPIALQLPSVSQTHILADYDELFNGSPDSEDEGEYTGNEGMASTYRYHNTVAVIMQKEDALLPLATSQKQSSSSLLAFFELLLGDQESSMEQHRETIIIILGKTLEGVIGNKSSSSSCYSYLPSYGSEAAIAYAKVFETITTQLYNVGLDSIVRNTLQSAVRRPEWTESPGLVNIVAQHVAREASEKKSNVWQDWLSAPLPLNPTYKNVSDRNQAFEAIRTALPSALLSSFLKWRDAVIDKMVREVKSYSGADVDSLLGLISYMSIDTYFKCISTCLMRVTNPPTILRFLLKLGAQNEGKSTDRERIIKPTYKRLLQASMASFKISVNQIEMRFNEYSKSQLYQRFQNHGDLYPDEFCAMLDKSMHLDLREEAYGLLSTGLPDLDAPESTFQSNWTAWYYFLREDLINLLQRHNDEQLNEISKPFIIRILQESSTHLASSRPVKPRDWSRPGAVAHGNCSCEPCRTARLFLIDPTARVGRFTYKEKIRNHLQHRFDYRDFKFDTERNRSPYTLLVYKTDNAYPRELQEWEEQIQSMRFRQLEMRSVFLTRVLGGDILDIAGLDSKLMTSGNAEGVEIYPRALQNVSASVQNQASFMPSAQTTKMNLQVIDLTEE